MSIIAHRRKQRKSKRRHWHTKFVLFAYDKDNRRWIFFRRVLRAKEKEYYEPSRWVYREIRNK